MSFINPDKQEINEIRIINSRLTFNNKNSDWSIWNEIVALQHKLNKSKAGEDYLYKDLPQNAAIIGESAELLISSAYEWWKDVIVDKQNMITEAIDVLHFLISQALQDFKQYHEDKLLIKIADIISSSYNDVIHPSGIYFSTKLLKEDTIILDTVSEKETNILQDLLIPISQELIYSGNTIEYRFKALFAIFGILGIEINEISRRYIVKNCLNQFRQDHGYKEGKYIKYYNSDNFIKGNLLRGIDKISLAEFIDTDKDKIEDNDLALAIALRTSVIENDENNNTLYKALYNNLEDVYKQLI